MKKITEMMIIAGGGALGGLVSVMDAWGDPTNYPMTFAKLFALFAVPFVKGAVAAGIGVYVLTSFDSNHIARSFFFAVACGLAFPSILTKSGSMVDSVTSQVAEISITENANTISSEIEKGLQGEAIDVAIIQKASENIVNARGKVDNSSKSDAEHAIKNALDSLAVQAETGDVRAISAISHIGKLSSKGRLTTSKKIAISKLKQIQDAPNLADSFKRRAAREADLLRSP